MAPWPMARWRHQQGLLPFLFGDSWWCPLYPLVEETNKLRLPQLASLLCHPTVLFDIQSPHLRWRFRMVLLTPILPCCARWMRAPSLRAGCKPQLRIGHSPPKLSSNGSIYEHRWAWWSWCYFKYDDHEYHHFPNSKRTCSMMLANFI